MKTTKATIYANYGIEYKSGKINTPNGGTDMKKITRKIIDTTLMIVSGTAIYGVVLAITYAIMF